MVETCRNIPDRVFVPPSSRERFLAVEEECAWPLRECGVQSAGVSDLTPPFSVSRACPPFHVALLTLSGEAQFVTDSESGVLGPGSLWVGPARALHGYVAQGPWHVCWFHLLASPRWEFLRPLRRAATVSEPLRAAMEGFLAETVRREEGAETAARAYAEVICVLLAREFGDADPSAAHTLRREVAALWEMVSGDVARSWTVPLLAERLCVSPVHLHRLSMRYHGIAPMAMVTRLRMRRAESLLRSTPDTLEQIADAVGYGTAFALSRAFKRELGLCPQEYRRQGSH